jgi:chromate transporter
MENILFVTCKICNTQIKDVVLYLGGVGEIPLMFGAGALAMLLANVKRLYGSTFRLAPLPLTARAQNVSLPALGAPSGLITLFLVFLKVGAVLYGSGYVLLAFLQRDLVAELGWLSNQQILDAVAVGQFTPGPVLTTATFIGFVVGSWWRAILATVGIFFPSFVFVAAVTPLVPRLRASPWFGALLDGVNIAAVALMAAVTLTLGRAAILDPLTASLALVAAVLLLRYKVNSAWLVLGGGAMAVLYHILLPRSDKKSRRASNRMSSRPIIGF